MIMICFCCRVSLLSSVIAFCLHSVSLFSANCRQYVSISCCVLFLKSAVMICSLTFPLSARCIFMPMSRCMCLSSTAASFFRPTTCLANGRNVSCLVSVPSKSKMYSCCFIVHRV